MFGNIANRVPRDQDYLDRTWRLDCLRRVLNGSLYELLPYQFHQERIGTGGDGEYIPISERQPSVRYGMCRMVVEDSVALLFGEGRFPTIDVDDPTARKILGDIVKETLLNRVMLEAALRGSIGSVVIVMRVLRGRLFFEVMDTLYLTPEWQDEAPDTLAKVVEQRKVKGSALIQQGYSIDDDDIQTDFWFVRSWDTDSETWYLPWAVGDTDNAMRKDRDRSVWHRLGFVPIVWIRNLPGGDAVDGACTFRAAIETNIEIDYQLSQAGRGLKYSSDPTLLLKEPATSDANLVRSSSSAIIVSADGDAKMLEISGTASSAVIEYVRTLREMALESIHGNRSNADRVSAAQSGRAMELLFAPLISLADNLRVSYGEDGLLRLMRMVIKASHRFELKVFGEAIAALPMNARLSLKWGPWFSLTLADKMQQAQAISAATAAGVMSRETAVKELAPTYDVEDVLGELHRIGADLAALNDLHREPRLDAHAGL
jgi:hypothetical protein